MPRPYKPLVPQSIGEVIEMLEWMRLSAPTFRDPSFDELYPGRDLDVVFYELNEGLGVIRRNLTKDQYGALRRLSDRMRAHFEADLEDKTGESLGGRALIGEMKVLLEGRDKG